MTKNAFIRNRTYLRDSTKHSDIHFYPIDLFSNTKDVYKMRPIRSSEQRILTKLAINPAISKSELAKSLGVTRSAITQSWSRLENEKNLAIRSIIDYPSLGLRGIFGWAETTTNSTEIENFSKWLHSNKFVHFITESTITSKMNHIVMFKAIVQIGAPYKHFINQLDRFRKRPYSLKVVYDDVLSSVNSTNLGLYDGTEWNFESKFRFGATIDAASDYAEILPTRSMLSTANFRYSSFSEKIIAFALRENYRVTTPQIVGLLKLFGEEPPSNRTIRRQLVTFRKRIAIPYIHITDIGLSNKIIICIEEDPNQSNLLKVFHAQASSFPRTHLVSSKKLMVLEVDVPTSGEYLTIAHNLSRIADSSTTICTFIARKSLEKKELQEILHNLR